MAVEVRRLEAENIVLRQAIGDMDNVLRAAVKLIEKTPEQRGDSAGSAVSLDPPWA